MSPHTQSEQDRAAQLISSAGGHAQSQGYGFHVTTLWPGKQVGRWMAPAEVIREFQHWRPQDLQPAAPAAAEGQPDVPAIVEQAIAEMPEREGHWVAEFHYADSDRVVRRQTTGDEPVVESAAEALFRITAAGYGLAEATVYLDQGDGLNLEYWGQMDFTAPPSQAVQDAAAEPCGTCGSPEGHHCPLCLGCPHEGLHDPSCKGLLATQDT